MKMTDYYPDPDKVRDGIKLPMFDAAGNRTEDFIIVRWAWSDEARAAVDAMKRSIAISFQETKESGGDVSKVNTQEQELAAIVAEVAGWSFEEEATPENVMEFLRRRPDVAERIDIAAGNTRLFFPESGESS